MAKTIEFLDINNDILTQIDADKDDHVMINILNDFLTCVYTTDKPIMDIYNILLNETDQIKTLIYKVNDIVFIDQPLISQNIEVGMSLEDERVSLNFYCRLIDDTIGVNEDLEG